MRQQVGRTALWLCGLWAAGCAPGNQASVAIDVGSLWQQSALSGVPMNTLRLAVSAPDLPTPIVTQVDASQVVVNADVPSGPKRVFEVQGLQGSGDANVLTYWGRVTADMPSGATVDLTIPIYAAGLLRGALLLPGSSVQSATTTVIVPVTDGPTDGTITGSTVAGGGVSEVTGIGSDSVAASVIASAAGAVRVSGTVQLVAHAEAPPSGAATDYVVTVQDGIFSTGLPAGSYHLSGNASIGTTALALDALTEVTVSQGGVTSASLRMQLAAPPSAAVVGRSLAVSLAPAVTAAPSVGAPLPTVTVSVLDGNNVVAADAVVPVTLALQNCATGLQVAVSGTLSGGTAQGVVTFAGLSTTVAGNLCFVANAAGLTAATSAPLTVASGPAVNLSLSAPAAVVVSNAAALTIDVVDAFGNHADHFDSVSVLFSSTDPNARLPIIEPLTSAQTPLRIDAAVLFSAAGSYSVTASDVNARFAPASAQVQVVQLAGGRNPVTQLPIGGTGITSANTGLVAAP